MRESYLWCEKFRPKQVEDCILPETMKSVFQEYVNKGEIPNLILTGSSGVGKTSVAKAMLDEIGAEYIMINGSNEGRLIDTLRTKLTGFASTLSLDGSRKYVIIDEGDYMNAESVQPALRNFIEQFHKNCGFIITCNYPNKLLEAIRSRCSVVHFSFNKKEKQQLAMEFYKSSAKILKNEGIEFDKSVLAEVVKLHMPDWRRVLNELQRYSSIGKIDNGILESLKGLSIDQLLKHLKEKEFTELRKLVASSYDGDFNVVCRELYDKAYEIVDKKSIPQLVLIIADYQWKNAFCADKEINFMAMLVEIMLEVQFKE